MRRAAPDCLRVHAVTTGEATGPVRPGDPSTFVVFGALGDLTKRKLLPSLYNLRANGMLPRDLAIVVPPSPLEAVMSNEVWKEVYRRLAELIEAHRTTLVFVNTRRMAERVTHHLSELLGADAVTSHHGSLSAKLRLEAEDRLKRGELKALVATASLELGIDIGSVDLVCQLGTTRSIATLLQRVGRAKHTPARNGSHNDADGRSGLPKGRIFPLSRDETPVVIHSSNSARL